MPEGGVLGLKRGQGSRTPGGGVGYSRYKHGVGIMQDPGLVSSFAIHQLHDLGQVPSRCDSISPSVKWCLCHPSAVRRPGTYSECSVNVSLSYSIPVSTFNIRSI